MSSLLEIGVSVVIPIAIALLNLAKIEGGKRIDHINIDQITEEVLRKMEEKKKI